MEPFRLSVRSLVALMAVVGFDLAVLIRAYQHGRWAGAVAGYLAGFGLVLLLLNLGLVRLGLTFARGGAVPWRERLGRPATVEVALALYLAVLALPILAILFLRPGTF